MIEIKELTKTYNSGEAKVNALRGITETIKDRENIVGYKEKQLSEYRLKKSGK